MNFDFALILVLATLVTGLGWLVDKLFFEPSRRKKITTAEAASSDGSIPEDAKEKCAPLPWWSDFSRSMFPVLAVVLIVRSFIIEPFQIPSGSMLPTLKIGDFIVVNKFSYGLRLPVLGTKIVPVGEPQRGDVVVFKYPKNPSVNYIKRLVGLPGDVITYKDKTIFVNGVAQEQTLVAKLPPINTETLLINETLGDVKHEMYTDVRASARSGSGEWVVPEGHYFMMGDNRDNSNDSRYWGYVPDELLVGKAFAVWMHWPTFFSLPDFSVVRGIE
ncbi:signal peptidase I [Neptunomonas phycophila]|uniref:Signal peptidase I n=1 Tax=Neptunomonas phycophila TaxID=1572645 RepID=A0AAW7XIX3_9GAMM|nr:signal peptidase I [Neptunomonas phycophila]MDO6452918.1 signal peptidase I [Neptunomonas phycophila]